MKITCVEYDGSKPGQLKVKITFSVHFDTEENKVQFDDKIEKIYHDLEGSYILVSAMVASTQPDGISAKYELEDNFTNRSNYLKFREEIKKAYSDVEPTLREQFRRDNAKMMPAWKIQHWMQEIKQEMDKDWNQMPDAAKMMILLELKTKYETLDKVMKNDR